MSDRFDRVNLPLLGSHSPSFLPGNRAMRALVLCLFLPLLGSFSKAAEPPTFVVRKANGTEIRAPLAGLDSNFRLEMGTKILRKLAPAEWVALRQVGLDLPPLPSDDQIVLASGDRIPARDLRLDDEKLRFRHPDLNSGKESVVPLTAVAMIWRLAPDGTLHVSQQRNRLLHSKRKRDTVLLRNGDKVEGTLEALSSDKVEIEIAQKKVVSSWPQVCAVLLSSDSNDKARPKQDQARLVLSATDRSPGGRLTVVAPDCDGITFSAKTTFGSLVRVPIERVVSLELSASHLVHLSDLTPNKYTYTPYLDENFGYGLDTNVLGRDLLLGGSYYGKGIGLHAGSRISYTLDGNYRRFDALIGLDDLDGREGNVRIRMLLDGKAVDLGKLDWTSRDRAVRISIDVAHAKEMTLLVEATGKGPIQGVVNVVEARLIRVSP